MTEQTDYFRKLFGARVGLIATKNSRELKSLCVKTESGDSIYICGDNMVCISPEEWVNRK